MCVPHTKIESYKYYTVQWKTVIVPVTIVATVLVIK